MLEVVVGGGVFLVLYLGLVWYRQQQQVSPNCPSVPGLPILGNSFLVLEHLPRMLDMLVEKTLVHKGPFQFKVIGQSQFICISDPESVKYILQDNFNNYIKGELFRDKLFDLLGDGIFDIDGEPWAFQRKTASHIFTRSQMSTFMTDVFKDHAQMCTDRLDQHTLSGKPLDLQDLFYRYTLESICKIAFGINLGCFDRENVEFAIAFDQAQQILMERLLSVIWPLRTNLRWLLPDERRLTKCIAELNQFAAKVIKDRRAEVDLDHKEDLLSRFMNTSNKDGQPLSDTELRDVIMSFVIAGRDTTANCLTWLFNELTQHPDIMAKLVAEVDTVLQGSLPTYEDLDRKMPYLTACVKETLRLHPSVPKDGKMSVARDTLPNGVIVPAGVTVIYMPYVMGRLESLWPNALAFTPERWLDGKPEPSPFKFTAFNAGPRICLGMNMAYVEAKMLTACILQKFKVTRLPGQTSEYAVTLTMPMLNGLRVVVERRDA